MSTHLNTPQSDQTSEGVAAVERALAIVDAIASVSEPITLAELSRMTGFYKSTLLRLLASLEKTVLVVRLSDGRYTLGAYAYRLGCSYNAKHKLTDIILPILHNLISQGTESASFHIYHDVQFRMCILRVDSNHATLDRIRPGDLLPLDRGAAGKLLTLFFVQKRTPKNPQDLVMTSVGERDPQCAAVASPVFDSENKMCGAISLSGPTERFTATAIETMSIQVLEAAKTATNLLGGSWPAVN